jgi:DNA-binding transcriptional regulator YiaG
VAAKKRANPWPAKLKQLRNGLGLTNDEVAAKLRIPIRLWRSWLYGERRPSPAAQALISLLEDGKIRD